VRAPRLAAALSLALIASLVALAVTRIDLAAAGRALSSVNAGWVAVALALMASSFMARGESWFAAIRAAAPAARIRRVQVTRGLLIGMATSTLAPARLGEAVRSIIVARHLGGARRALAPVLGTVLSQTLLNLLALSILSGVALSGAGLAHGRLAGLLLAVGLPMGILFALFALPVLLERGVRSEAAWLRDPAAWLSRQLIEVRRGLAAFRRPHSAAHTALAQLGAWCLQLGTCYAVMLAFHLGDHATLAAAAAVLVAVNLTAILPATPSNVGVFQAACIAVLAPFGIGASKALAYGIVMQGVEVVDALALGLPALLREGLSFGELRRSSGELRRSSGELRRSSGARVT
jgi:phosphatidylinositol alpha-mannosyltransferase